jgi:hypothetical protein
LFSPFATASTFLSAYHVRAAGPQQAVLLALWTQLPDFFGALISHWEQNDRAATRPGAALNQTYHVTYLDFWKGSFFPRLGNIHSMSRSAGKPGAWHVPLFVFVPTHGQMTRINTHLSTYHHVTILHLNVCRAAAPACPNLICSTTA